MLDHETRAASGSTSLPLSPRDATWDAGEAKKSLQTADYPKAFFWNDPEGDKTTLAAYKLPFAQRGDNGLVAVWKGITSAAQRLSSLKGVPEADMAGIKSRIGAYYKQAATKYDDDTIKVPWAQQNTREPDLVEVRYAVTPILGVDVRDPQANDDGSWTMSGYAAVFDQATTLYDGKFVKLTESIDPAAFDRCLREQGLSNPDGVVHFNRGHDMNTAVAATDVPAGDVGSLTLRADSKGLFYLARVSRDDPDGLAMAAKMRAGVLKQASFAFTINKAEYVDTETDDGPDEEHRRIVEIGHLYDVCACPQGAYSQTVSQLRSMAAALGQPTLQVGGQHRQPDGSGGEGPVSPSQHGGKRDGGKRLSRELERRISAHARV